MISAISQSGHPAFRLLSTKLIGKILDPRYTPAFERSTLDIMDRLASYSLGHVSPCWFITWMTTAKNICRKCSCRAPENFFVRN